jgi:uncharacterized protein (TIGR04255 family)
MGRKYKNPPFVEAVCEFRLTQDTQWDLTVPGLFYERVKHDFPHREQRVIQEFGVTLDPEGLQQAIRATERVMMFAPDRKMLVQLGPRLLVINALKPYPTWQGFKPRIEMAWKALQEVVEVKGLERIGLRYINRIEFPSQAVEREEYFEFYPFIGRRLPQQVASFHAIAEFRYTDDRDRCRVQLVAAAGTEARTAVILDIDYFVARPRAVDVSHGLNWVEEAHSQVEEVFEGCITDRLRAMFEEEVP